MTASDVTGFMPLLSDQKSGKVSPDFGVISILNCTWREKKKKIRWRKHPEIADFCRWSWSNVFLNSTALAIWEIHPLSSAPKLDNSASNEWVCTECQALSFRPFFTPFLKELAFFAVGRPPPDPSPTPSPWRSSCCYENWFSPWVDSACADLDLEGPKHRHASAFRMHSNTQVVPAFYCIPTFLRHFVRCVHS